MIRCTDQLGQVVSLEQPANRIVSLVPSQTELLYYLGVSPIAKTVFCIHPSKEFKNATKIGGTKKLQLDKIKALKPDLIIGNKEENVQEEIMELQNHFPVWMSDVNTLDQAYEMIEKVGVLIGKETQSSTLNNHIRQAFNRLITPKSTSNSVLYLIWKDPFYGVGNNTFIHDVLTQSAFQNVLKNEERYPEISLEKIKELAPQYLFLSTEPFPFKEAHVTELQQHLPHTKVVLVDGEMFSWYGNRLLQTPSYINQLFSDIRGHESQS